MRFQWRFLMVPVAVIALQAGGSAAALAKPAKYRQPLHRAGNYAIQQIRPGLPANGALALAGSDKIMDGPRRYRASHVAQHRRNLQPDLAGALIAEPNSQTEPVLAELGIPAIQGVPPVALLSQGSGHRQESEVFASAAGIR